jgi:hypothetical protein
MDSDKYLTYLAMKLKLKLLKANKSFKTIANLKYFCMTKKLKIPVAN